MDWENCKTSKPNVLILNLTDKIDLQRSEKSVDLSNLSIYYTWKNMKNSYVEWLIQITRRIIFCIRYSGLFWVYLKKHGKILIIYKLKYM